MPYLRYLRHLSGCVSTFLGGFLVIGGVLGLLFQTWQPVAGLGVIGLAVSVIAFVVTFGEIRRG